MWEAYIECAKHFDIDSAMNGYLPLHFSEDRKQGGPEWEQSIVYRSVIVVD